MSAVPRCGTTRGCTRLPSRLPGYLLFTFLSLGEVIGGGTRDDLTTDEIRRLMAGGQELAKLEAILA